MFVLYFIGIFLFMFSCSFATGLSEYTKINNINECFDNRYDEPKETWDSVLNDSNEFYEIFRLINYLVT
jgi:hypothetical protein